MTTNEYSSELLTRYESILKTLIAFPTISGTSNATILDWITTYLERFGVSVFRFPSEYDRSIDNLFILIGNMREHGGLCFSGHLDVVPPQGTGWKTDPFILVRCGDAYYGRGTTDMKGAIAAWLAMVPVWKARSLQYPVSIALTYDEEIGCKSMPAMINGLVKNGRFPDAVIIGEPTQCKPIYGHKGGAECTTELFGQAAHASIPDAGNNAIYSAVEFIDVIRAFQDSNDVDDGQTTQNGTTVSVGTVHGGTARNIVPDYCRFDWEVRTAPGTDPLSVVKTIESQFLTSVGPTPDRSRTTVETSYPGLIPCDNSLSLRWIRSMGCDASPDFVSFGTEAGFYNEAGIPTVVWGPGSIERAHITDEYIRVDEIRQYLDYLQRLPDAIPNE